MLYRSVCEKAPGKMQQIMPATQIIFLKAGNLVRCEQDNQIHENIFSRANSYFEMF